MGIAILQNRIFSVKLTRLDFLLILFCSFMFFSGIISNTPEFMLIFFKRIPQFFAIYFLIRIFIRSYNDFLFFYQFNLFISITILIILLWQFLIGELSSGIGRPHLAFFALPFLLSYTFMFQDERIKWGFISILISFLGFFSDSRRMFIGLLMYWSLFLFNELKNQNKKNKIISVSIIFIILIFIMPDSITRRLNFGFQGLLDISRGENVYDLQSDVFTNRDKLWTIGYNIWSENIMLGIGTMNAPQFMNAYSDFDGDYEGKRMHNFYLRILAEQGIVGFVIFLFIFYEIFNYLIINRNSLKKSDKHIPFMINKIFYYKQITLAFMYIFGGWGIYDKLFWIDTGIIMAIYHYNYELKYRGSKITSSIN